MPSLQDSVRKNTQDIGEILKTVFLAPLKAVGVETVGKTRLSLAVGLVMVLVSVASLFNAALSGGRWVVGKISAFVPGLQNTGQLAAATAATGQPIQNPQSRMSADAKDCDFSVGHWQPWQGNLITSLDDSTYVALPLKEQGAALAYQGELAQLSPCEFSFVPRGENAVNFMISLDGVFQVVIGDNDFKTVSLRASEALDAPPTLPVKELETGKERPRLLSSLKSGSEVKVRLHQRLLEATNEYEVRAEIHYTPIDSAQPVEQLEQFTWVFSPSPTLQVRSPQISLGLLRGEGDQGEVAISFLSPNPLSALLPQRGSVGR